MGTQPVNYEKTWTFDGVYVRCDIAGLPDQAKKLKDILQDSSFTMPSSFLDVPEDPTRFRVTYESDGLRYRIDASPDFMNPARGELILKMQGPRDKVSQKVGILKERL